ncbi:thiosulfate oxidation carrier protein SoxY [Pararhizobium haloflavum]|uniref:thiosulfate oxidation carrier protein SoxY n=1 Tax=Pararhizobium haloflavum TaxID=2037914 RepID=UPI000C184365|nr:thiosulfate oxidation carrier protein SoxY [Pararhizobium haloflavum]
MKMNRRQMMAATAGAAAFVATGFRISPARATPEATQEAIDAFTGGAKPETGRITLDAPEIAENGNTVPISVSVESDMTEESYVEEVSLFAEGNPEAHVATFKFSPMSGSADATTRIRLASSQNVIAVAKMNDGSVFMDTKEVKVTIGGCGG